MAYTARLDAARATATRMMFFFIVKVLVSGFFPCFCKQLAKMGLFLHNSFSGLTGDGEGALKNIARKTCRFVDPLPGRISGKSSPAVGTSPSKNCEKLTSCPGYLWIGISDVRSRPGTFRSRVRRRFLSTHLHGSGNEIQYFALPKSVFPALIYTPSFQYHCHILQRHDPARKFIAGRFRPDTGILFQGTASFRSRRMWILFRAAGSRG